MFGGFSLTHLASTTELLNSYEIGSEIGSGASATVYSVTEKLSQKPYVMKVISTLGLTEGEQKNVQAEVEALKRANHPNIIMHHESDINDQNCVIIMEKCEATLENVIDSARIHVEKQQEEAAAAAASVKVKSGWKEKVKGSRDVVKRSSSSSSSSASSDVPNKKREKKEKESGAVHAGHGTKEDKNSGAPALPSPFPEELLIEWMAELLSALQYLHKHRIVHRDIKTGNIFVSRKNHLKLGDFGVCTILAAPDDTAVVQEGNTTTTINKGHANDESHVSTKVGEASSPSGSHYREDEPSSTSPGPRSPRKGGPSQDANVTVPRGSKSPSYSQSSAHVGITAGGGGAATYSFVGTPFYIAPEVCLGEPWTPQSDVWSLGIVLYELCTLRRPFDGLNVMHLVEAITESPIPPFPSGHLKDSRFEMIVLSMLNRDPLKRPTVKTLLEKYFVLPASHPSHPLMPPAKARDVQYHHGPKLGFPIIEPQIYTGGDSLAFPSVSAPLGISNNVGGGGFDAEDDPYNFGGAQQQQRGWLTTPRNTYHHESPLRAAAAVGAASTSADQDEQSIGNQKIDEKNNRLGAVKQQQPSTAAAAAVPAATSSNTSNKRRVSSSSSTVPTRASPNGLSSLQTATSASAFGAPSPSLPHDAHHTRNASSSGGGGLTRNTNPVYKQRVPSHRVPSSSAASNRLRGGGGSALFDGAANLYNRNTSDATAALTEKKRANSGRDVSSATSATAGGAESHYSKSESGSPLSPFGMVGRGQKAFMKQPAGTTPFSSSSLQDMQRETAMGLNASMKGEEKDDGLPLERNNDKPWSKNNNRVQRARQNSSSLLGGANNKISSAASGNNTPVRTRPPTGSSATGANTRRQSSFMSNNGTGGSGNAVSRSNSSSTNFNSSVSQLRRAATPSKNNNKNDNTSTNNNNNNMAHHSDAFKQRIKNAKSTVNMAELRKQMLAKHKEEEQKRQNAANGGMGEVLYFSTSTCSSAIYKRNNSLGDGGGGVEEGHHARRPPSSLAVIDECEHVTSSSAFSASSSFVPRTNSASRGMDGSSSFLGNNNRGNFAGNGSVGNDHDVANQNAGVREQVTVARTQLRGQSPISAAKTMGVSKSQQRVRAPSTGRYSSEDQQNNNKPSRHVDPFSGADGSPKHVEEINLETDEPEQIAQEPAEKIHEENNLHTDALFTHSKKAPSAATRDTLSPSSRRPSSAPPSSTAQQQQQQQPTHDRHNLSPSKLPRQHEGRLGSSELGSSGRFSQTYRVTAGAFTSLSNAAASHTPVDIIATPLGIFGITPDGPERLTVEVGGGSPKRTSRSVSASPSRKPPLGTEEAWASPLSPPSSAAECHADEATKKVANSSKRINPELSAVPQQKHVDPFSSQISNTSVKLNEGKDLARGIHSDASSSSSSLSGADENKKSRPFRRDLSFSPRADGGRPRDSESDSSSDGETQSQIPASKFSQDGRVKSAVLPATTTAAAATRSVSRQSAQTYQDPNAPLSLASPSSPLKGEVRVATNPLALSPLTSAAQRGGTSAASATVRGDSTPPAPTTPLRPLERVMKVLAVCEDELTINDLDDLALALNRIRIRRFGVY